MSIVPVRRSGKHALQRQTAAQWARDMIEQGENPQKFIAFVGPGGIVRATTLEEAAEMAFVGDTIERAIVQMTQNT